MRFLAVLGVFGLVLFFSVGLVLGGSGGFVGGSVACDLNTCSPLESCPASYVSGGDCYYNFNFQGSCAVSTNVCGDSAVCVYDNVDSTQPDCSCGFTWLDPSQTNEVMLRNASVVCDASSGWVCDWNSAEQIVCSSALECVSRVCGGTSYTCVFTGVRWDWLTPGQMPGEVCDDGFDNDCDGLVDCADPDCAGQTGPNGVTCCNSDSYCTGYGPNNLKIVCECPSSGCSLTGSSYTCKEKTSCSDSSECAPNYCCDADPSLPPDVKGSGQCKQEGTVLANTYLCDPVVGGFVDEQGDMISSLDGSSDREMKGIDLLRRYIVFLNWMLVIGY